jgi:HlyD family secretion protein
MYRKIAFFLSVLILASCGSKQENSETEATSIIPVNVVGVGKIVPQGGVIELAAPAAGIVMEINAKPGEKVSRGDLILTLYNSDEELALKEADSRIRTQEMSIESAKITIDQERIAYSDLTRQLNDAKELLSAGATTGENVRRLQSEFDQKTERLKILENDYNIKKSQLNEIRVQRASKANELDKTLFRAPLDGTLLDITPREGEAVSMHQQGLQ